jgi:hypothetical protein
VSNSDWQTDGTFGSETPLPHGPNSNYSDSGMSCVIGQQVRWRAAPRSAVLLSSGVIDGGSAVSILAIAATANPSSLGQLERKYLRAIRLRRVWPANDQTLFSTRIKAWSFSKVVLPAQKWQLTWPIESPMPVAAKEGPKHLFGNIVPQITQRQALRRSRLLVPPRRR